LVCATHGATYEPATGHCIMGPCKGSHLIAAQVEERDGSVYLVEPYAT
jgi:nitrite reductase/ring-hydroxylating ferredoxin subunit